MFLVSILSCVSFELVVFCISVQGLEKGEEAVQVRVLWLFCASEGERG